MYIVYQFNSLLYLGYNVWLAYFQMSFAPGMVDGLGSKVMQRRQLYSNPMSKLRGLMINRMAKPEEVLIVEDENGNIVRETMKDNDVLVQYKVLISSPGHITFLQGGYIYTQLVL